MDATLRIIARKSARDVRTTSSIPRPLTVFAGIWTPWTSVRKVGEGETPNDLLRFLTTEPNAEVGAPDPKAKPVIMQMPEEIKIWMTAPASEALTLQKPLPDRSLTIVARGKEEDRSASSRDTQASATRASPTAHDVESPPQRCGLW